MHAQVMPIHDHAFINGLVPKLWAPFPEVGKLHEYYGDALGLYFAWMAFMCRWLAVPACLGLLTFVLHQVTGTPNTDGMHYSIFSKRFLSRLESVSKLRRENLELNST
jgi:Calcium-activated chloride channel